MQDEETLAEITSPAVSEMRFYCFHFQ